MTGFYIVLIIVVAAFSLLCVLEVEDEKIRGDSAVKTLDEAIRHSLEIAENNKCVECRGEHKQLAEWLKELKRYREKEKGE